MTTITPEQRQAVAEAGGLPVELADPQTDDAFVLVRAEIFQKMRELIEDDEGLREKQAWGKLARKAREQWAGENAY